MLLSGAEIRSVALQKHDDKGKPLFKSTGKGKNKSTIPDVKIPPSIGSIKMLSKDEK